ncbi:hypothetical protein M430DRAFT_36850 [Amorphotheca resinae ATCC 22711]|uniref:Uncharacterized protein n=1 Tax=Amorphotheca resinae ATCC 22711 TaxID=857342 RepID=A0A2T3ASV9_AMORE|nr:hypothetical protein M430DRAFT_36850 [Amorphotheca resinae ATCC 22711]PSS10557.1 hypothetical protein M430DRAFT_36850 [Amorphotheca resinae ATCC 22711]
MPRCLSLLMLSPGPWPLADPVTRGRRGMPLPNSTLTQSLILTERSGVGALWGIATYVYV